ncbi:MAG: hypothetical protein O6848_07325 [Bacteroidetes bacterium]|nr:hypothetical protein [Bacteroidota bacterium]
MIATRFTFILLTFLVIESSFGQPNDFKVVENRRIKNQAVRVWPYESTNLRKNTYINFEVFLAGSETDIFTASTYKSTGFIYIGCNINSPSLNKSGKEIHLPLYLLDVEDKRNLKIIEIPEGINLLQKVYFRADQRGSYFKLEFRAVGNKNRSEFLSTLSKLENSMAKSITLPITDLPTAYVDRDVKKLKENSQLLLESIDVIERTDLIKEKTSIAYIIQPLEYKKDFKPKSFKGQTLEVDRTYDPLLEFDRSEIRYPYLILDVNLKSYILVEGLPSNHKTDFRCSTIEEQSKIFTQTIDKYSSYMSQQQRIFETNLKNITDEYIYFMQGVGSDVSSGNSEDNMFDDEGFLLDDDEIEESTSYESYSTDQLLKDYCNFTNHVDKFKNEIAGNDDPNFTKYYKNSLKDIISCINLNFIERLEDVETRNSFKSGCQK